MIATNISQYPMILRARKQADTKPGRSTKQNKTEDRRCRSRILTFVANDAFSDAITSVIYVTLTTAMCVRVIVFQFLFYFKVSNSRLLILLARSMLVRMSYVETPVLVSTVSCKFGKLVSVSWCRFRLISQLKENTNEIVVTRTNYFLM